MAIQLDNDTTYALDDIIHLNVGGKRFDTTLRTLLSDKNHELYDYFSILLVSGLTVQQQPMKDETGAFFLDQDPYIFKITLNNLRYLSTFTSERGVSNYEGCETSENDKKSSKTLGFWQKLRKK